MSVPCPQGVEGLLQYTQTHTSKHTRYGTTTMPKAKHRLSHVYSTDCEHRHVDEADRA